MNGQGGGGVGGGGGGWVPSGKNLLTNLFTIIYKRLFYF
jgi:hypothetical protein